MIIKHNFGADSCDEVDTSFLSGQQTAGHSVVAFGFKQACQPVVADISGISTIFLDDFLPGKNPFIWTGDNAVKQVLSPLSCDKFDAVDMALFLTSVGFAGKYRVIVAKVPDTAMICREIKEICLKLNFDVICLNGSDMGSKTG